MAFFQNSVVVAAVVVDALSSFTWRIVTIFDYGEESSIFAIDDDYDDNNDEDVLSLVIDSSDGTIDATATASAA